jgi:hypothetical protein
MCLVVAAGIMALAAYSSAKNQKKQGEYQAQIDRNNASAAEWQAADAVQRGNAAAATERRKGQQTLGTQRAAMAAAGLDISSGSALSILEDTDYFNEADQLTIKSNAAREAWGYKVQASHSMASANLRASAADNINPLFEGVKAGAGAYFMGGGGSGGGSLMTSGSGVNPKWYSGGVNGSAGTSYIPSNMG